MDGLKFATAVKKALETMSDFQILKFDPSTQSFKSPVSVKGAVVLSPTKLAAAVDMFRVDAVFKVSPFTLDDAGIDISYDDKLRFGDIDFTILLKQGRAHMPIDGVTRPSFWNIIGITASMSQHITWKHVIGRDRYAQPTTVNNDIFVTWYDVRRYSQGQGSNSPIDGHRVASDATVLCREAIEPGDILSRDGRDWVVSSVESFKDDSGDIVCREVML